MHLVAASERLAVGLRLSAGQSGDAPQGRELIRRLKLPRKGCALAMDRAYEGNETRRLARRRGFKPVVPPNPNRLRPWQYSKRLYRRRNEVERLFRRLKGFRAVFTRYDKLDRIYLAGLFLALAFLLC